MLRKSGDVTSELSEGEYWGFEGCSFQTMPKNTARCFKLCGTDISYFVLYHLRFWHINYLDRCVLVGVAIQKTNSFKVPDLFLYLFACLMSKRKLRVFCATEVVLNEVCLFSPK